MIEEKSEIIYSILNGRYKFLARIPGSYSDDFGMVYLIDGYSKAKGKIVTVQSGMMSTYDSVADMIKFYKTLSERPHNLETIKIMEKLVEGRP